MPDPLRAKLVSESASGMASASISPPGATRNWVRLACVTCYEMLRWTKRLRRGMGGAGWVVAQDGRDLTVERVGCDTLGFPAVVAGDLWPPRTKGYHDVRTEKPSDPGHAARRAG